MSYLSLMEAKLPPGFRFHPRDEELVCEYLAKKVTGRGNGNSNHGRYETPLLVEVDLNKIEPWDLPEAACVGGKEWYFFSVRDRKYATGLRTNRATVSGYWKATGKDRPVTDVRRGTLVGMRKTLVFYQGRAPKGKKTDWVMHEFRLEGSSEAPKVNFKEDWVLCRVFYKNRGASGKACQENSYDETSPASSLPPLMDPYLAFDQAPLNLEGLEQVPCFSNILSAQATLTGSMPQLPFLDTDHYPNSMPAARTLAHLMAPSDLAAFFNPISSEKKVIKAVLDHFTKLESCQNQKMVSPILGEGGGGGGGLHSYLPPHLGLPIMWDQ